MSKPGRLSAIAALAATLVTGTVPAFGGPVCLDTTRIHSTTVKDANTIDFRMRDGTVWRNTLKYACPDLKWWGFVYVVNGPNEVCENLQAIRVIHTGMPCMLGSFTKLPPAAPPGHA